MVTKCKCYYLYNDHYVVTSLVANKVASASETRQVEVGEVDSPKRKHNKIKTSKYTLLLFVPKNLSEQFRRIANFYFLIVTLIAIFIDSPVSPYTSIAPLTFMVMVTAVKQGYEDWLRHKEDDRVNNKIVEIVHKGVIKQVKNSTIAPGTLVRVRRGKEVPADLVLLCSADEKGKCFITTANLDGETNLKTLRVPPPLVGYTPDILPQGMRIEIPNPIPDLYTFYGRLDIPDLDSIVLSTDNIMLRGSRVKNTEWAIGCAIYTGEETKLALNSKYAGNKFSSCELATNMFLLFFIILLIIEIVGSYVAKFLIERYNGDRDVYLGPGSSTSLRVSGVLQDMFSFLLLYYYIIPMSLYVTIELNKLLGTYFFTWDKDLSCEETGRPALANTSDLNEDLGQIEVLFSDKTGTLTKNLMAFKSCSIKGHIYEERDSKLYDTEGFEDPVNIQNNDIRFFFTILALCHTVQISSEDMRKLSVRLSQSGNPLDFLKIRKLLKSGASNQSSLVRNGTAGTVLNDGGGNIEYQASSPDEKALVEAAARVGVTFLGEDGNDVLIKIGDDTEMYERLQLIEFTSERKRMSVIVRDKNGKIWLFCKGAESSIFTICKDSLEIEETNTNVNLFANEGLRTLAIAYREIPEDEYYKTSESIKRIEITDAESLQQVTQQYRSLERELTLIGVTAVEDCLQDDVADTLASLRRAGIKIWVLTGDKVETAINVAQSSAHISENDRRMFLIGVEDEEAIQAHLDECKKILAETSYKDVTLIVDGTTMTQVLDTPYASDFVQISLQCHAVLCCRLSPIQKAKIVKLIKESPERPMTAAIEGHQAARSADFAFTKFSMLKKIVLVMGHWYYQRLTTLIHYFFYKNLVLGNIMLFFQIHSAFSTQSIYDSLFLTIYNLIPTSIPCLVLSITEQRWSANTLFTNPALYRDISKNKLMTWQYFGAWSAAATYHSVIIYFFFYGIFTGTSLNSDMKSSDLWSFGAALFHISVVVVSLKLWLQTRYHTLLLVGTIVCSVLVNVVINIVYSIYYLQYDGDVLGTYVRLLRSLPFWLTNVLVVVASLAPDFCTRLLTDNWKRRISSSITLQNIFVTNL
ncbi:hypothetical protein ACJJTC_006825 [Scirpophaga incertulas]